MIVVIGGTDLIGSKLVSHRVEARRKAQRGRARAARCVTWLGCGHVYRRRLAQTLEGAQVGVDVSNTPAWDDAAVMDFFQTSSRNILAAETAARVSHHVVLSVVGTDRLKDSGYFRTKLAQEEAVKAEGRVS